MFNQPDPALKLRFFWLAIGYALVMLVVYMSVTSNPIQGPDFPYQDKFSHALAYFTLMSWFAQIYHDRFQRNMIAVVFLLMGLLMEYIQSFDPQRMAEMADMLANASGVALGLVLASTGLKNTLLVLEKKLKF